MRTGLALHAFARPLRGYAALADVSVERPSYGHPRKCLERAGCANVLALVKITRIPMILVMAALANACATAPNTDETQEASVSNPKDMIILTGGAVEPTDQNLRYVAGLEKLRQISRVESAIGQQTFIVPNLSAAAVRDGAVIPVIFFDHFGLDAFQRSHPDFITNHPEYELTVGLGVVEELDK